MKREIGATQIRVDRTVPFLRLKLVDGSPDTVDARVGEDDVEPAEGLNQIVDRLAHLPFVGHVGHERERLAARLLDLLCDLSDLVFRVTQHTDHGSLTGEA